MGDVIEIWPNGAPGSETWTQQQRTLTAADGEQRLVNVTAPTLTPFLPSGDVPATTAVIVAPGGGYRMLSMDSEGAWVARWLSDRGVAAYVLAYRLVDTGETEEELALSFATMMSGTITAESIAGEVRSLAAADAAEAVRLVRSSGVERVGFIGFSAGGMVASDVASVEDPTARPDFVAPIYGAFVPEEVAADAPPLFSMICADDPLCFELCMETFKAWRRAGRPAELHVYERGGHGFGLGKQGLPVDSWIDRFGDWMAANGWMGD